MLTPIKFGAPVQTLDSTSLRDGELAALINGFIDQDGSTYKMRPGLTTWKSLSAAGKPVIGLYHDPTVTPSHVLVVYNGASTAVLAKVTSNGTVTTITGTTLANSTLCTFATDGTYVYVANGGYINKVNVSAGTATLLNAGNAPNNVTHVAFLQTFLISNGLISGGVAGDTNFSDDAVNGYVAATSWEFFNNEDNPDACTALFVKWDEIQAWGPSSTESSFNDGTTPWAIIKGAQLHYGAFGPYTVSFINETFMFLSVVDNGVRFIRINQRSPQDASSKIETYLYGLTDGANAKAWSVNWKGLPLYMVTFPADDITLVYNVRRDEWYRWLSWDGAAYHRHAINSYAYVQAFNKHLIGDRTDAIIWELTGITDNGSAIRWQLESGHISHGTSQTKFTALVRMKFKRGATSSGEPTISYEINDDNEGYAAADTFSLGTTTDPNVFVELYGLGSYRQRQWRLTYSGTTTDIVFNGAEEDFDLGSS